MNPTVCAPLVTIVIPCYNHGHFLQSALASVAAQNYAPIETIVVDDGSRDQTAAVATPWGSTIIQQSNAGLGAARNAGLRAARGQFVVFLDADDELMPGAVASGVAVLQAAPRASMVARRSVLVDEAGRLLPSTYRELDNSDLYGELLGHNFLWTPGAAVFRRAPLQAIGGFPADVAAAADYAVYLQLARSTEILFDPREVVRYRQHGDNMSKDPMLMLSATLEVLKRERHLLPAKYRAAYRRGRRGWQEYYGDDIVEQLRRSVRAGGWSRPQFRAVWMLLRCCPAVVVKHLLRKLLRTLRGWPDSKIVPTHVGAADSDATSPSGRRAIH